MSIGSSSLRLPSGWGQSAARLGGFVALAAVGLFIVKWNPYFHRVFVVAASHSLGASIVSGTSAAPPAPSPSAALDYAIAYGKSIWPALVLGLLLAATIEAVLPSRWLIDLLGGPRFRATALGGAIALPGMM